MQNNYNWDFDLVGEVDDYPSDKHLVESDLTLLALPPPKRFLDEGSVFWESPDARWVFKKRGNPNRGHGKHMHIWVDKFHFHYPYVRLMGISYYFMRDKNCMMEQKKHFVSLVYNLETRIIYTVKGNPIYVNGKCKKVNKMVKRISLNKLHIPTDSHSFHRSNIDKFINVVKNKVLEDVPCVHDEATGFKTRLIALNIQHRIGKPIPGLNDTFIANLQPLVIHGRFRDTVSKGIIPPRNRAEMEQVEAVITKKVNKELNKTLYRFIPTLKKTGSLKKALKVLLTEEYYISILPTLIQNVSFDTVALQGRFMQFLRDYEERVPKAIQHELTRLTKSGDFTHITELMSHLVNMINDDHISKRIKDAWIRTMIRFGEPVAWTTWRDMYNMAGLLGGLRIRPNRFTTPAEVQALHDTYSTIMRARSPSRHNINKELMTFLEIDYPEEVLHEGQLDNKYVFIQMLTPRDLTDESDKHDHCVHSYVDLCFEGRSVIFRLLINGEPTFTVEYDGETLHYIHAEGTKEDGIQRVPDEYVLEDIIKPFGALLRKHENNNPLNYKVRAGLKADLIKIWADISNLESQVDTNLTDLLENTIEEHMEVLNCDLENRTEIAKAIDDGNIPHQGMLEKLAKVNRHTANQLAVNRNARPRPVAAPAVVHPVPLPAPLLGADPNGPGNVLEGPAHDDDHDEFPL